MTIVSKLTLTKKTKASMLASVLFGHWGPLPQKMKLAKSSLPRQRLRARAVCKLPLTY